MRKLAIAGLAAVLLGAGALGNVAEARKNDKNDTCTQSMFTGPLGGKLTGWYNYSGSRYPVAGIGVFTVGGNGAVSGYFTVSVDGAIAYRVKASGTFTIDAKCTGTIDMTISDPKFPLNSIKFDYVVTDLEGVVGVSTTPGATLTFTSTAVATKGRHTVDDDDD